MKIVLNERQVKKLTKTINEGKSEDTYFNTYSSALSFMRNSVEKRGYTISDDEWFREVNVGPKKPSEDKTNRLSLSLMKGDKETKKKVHVQVYNRGNEVKNNYELNFYID